MVEHSTVHLHSRRGVGIVGRIRVGPSDTVVAGIRGMLWSDTGSGGRGRLLGDAHQAWLGAHSTKEREKRPICCLLLPSPASMSLPGSLRAVPS